MTKKEELLIELVHMLAYGSKHEMGLTLRETKQLLKKKMSSKGGRTPIECLETNGKSFINEIRTFLNEVDAEIARNRKSDED